MSPKNSNANLGKVLGYTFPRLHTGKEWYVDFQAIDPETGFLKRKKYYITSQKSKREMRKSADALIEKLGIQLRQGWTPWETNKNKIPPRLGLACVPGGTFILYQHGLYQATNRLS